MKRVLLVILSIVILLGMTVPVFAADGGILLAKDGTTRYKIVIAENATATEVNAADILSSYLNQITSAHFSVIRDTEAEAPYEILVGITNRETANPVDRTNLGDEGVRIFTAEQKLFLTGGEKRGAIYAVYTFLEEFLGCRWFTKAVPITPDVSDCTVIPEVDVLTIAPIDYTYVPPFQLRQTYWMFSTMYPDYSVAHKLHGVMAGVPEDLGGIPVHHCINSVHTMGWIIPADLFAQHPEYFGMDANGTRQLNRQPCFSNEDVLAITIAAAKAHFAQADSIFSVSQNDNQDFCKCSTCAAFNDAHGGVESASLIHFVNKVAQAVREDYPEAKVETLAYQLSEAPPTGLAVEDNVVIRLCPIQTCVLHPLDDPSCPDNKEFDTNLTGWMHLAKNIYIWDYSTNFQYVYAFFPNITTLQGRYQYFRDRNVTAVFDHGCGENIIPAELHELRTYLVCKLLWDPDTDIQRHIREFCDAYYGAAAEDVLQFIYYFEDAIKGFSFASFGDCHMTCYDGGESLENHSSLTEIDVAVLNGFVKQAKCKNLTADQQKHLEGFELSWRFFKNAIWAGEFNWFLPWNNPEEASRALYYDMKNYGVSYLSEASAVMLSEEEPNFLLYPTFWYYADADLPLTVKMESKLFPAINWVSKLVFVSLIVVPACWLFLRWQKKRLQKCPDGQKRYIRTPKDEQ